VVHSDRYLVQKSLHFSSFPNEQILLGLAPAHGVALTVDGAKGDFKAKIWNSGFAFAIGPVINFLELNSP